VVSLSHNRRHSAWIGAGSIAPEDGTVPPDQLSPRSLADWRGDVWGGKRKDSGQETAEHWPGGRESPEQTDGLVQKCEEERFCGRVEKDEVGDDPVPTTPLK
jgi:hypothetical protein